MTPVLLWLVRLLVLILIVRFLMRSVTALTSGSVSTRWSTGTKSYVRLTTLCQASSGCSGSAVPRYRLNTSLRRFTGVSVSRSAPASGRR